MVHQSGTISDMPLRMLGYSALTRSRHIFSKDLVDPRCSAGQTEVCFDIESQSAGHLDSKTLHSVLPQSIAKKLALSYFERSWLQRGEEHQLLRPRSQYEDVPERPYSDGRAFFIDEVPDHEAYKEWCQDQQIYKDYQASKRTSETDPNDRAESSAEG